MMIHQNIVGVSSTVGSRILNGLSFHLTQSVHIASIVSSSQESRLGSAAQKHLLFWALIGGRR